MMRYDRCPGKELLKLFEEGNILSCLKDELKPTKQQDLSVFDVQFRENDSAAIYCGTTRVVRLQLKDNVLLVSANKTYMSQECAIKLMGAWEIEKNKPLDFKEALNNYLNNVQVEPKYWGKEGRIQVVWEQRCGRNYDANVPWMIIDREVVIGYDSDSEKNAVSIDVINSIIEKINFKSWAKLKFKRPNELDLLGISKNGEKLILLEVKDATTNSNNIYYAPMQLLYYVLEWQNALNSNECLGILKDINKLIEAKKEIGFLPGKGPLVSEVGVDGVLPLLVVEQMMWSEEVKKRFKMVLEIINEETDGILNDLQIWEYPNGLNPKQLDFSNI